MKLQNQVCSLELSKKLKDLGVPQESYFYWVETNWENEAPENDLKDYFLEKPIFQLRHNHFFDRDESPIDVKYSAFTVAELGEMLPENIFFKKVDAENYALVSYPEEYPTQKAETEADARAKMLIYLLENGLINFKK